MLHCGEAEGEAQEMLLVHEVVVNEELPQLIRHEVKQVLPRSRH